MTQRRRRGKTPSVRDREDIFGDAVSNMSDAYLKCRDIAHEWEVTRDYHLVDAKLDVAIQPRLGHDVFVRRLLRCTRCGKKRNDAFVVATKRGWQALEKLNSTYDDPPGYLVKGVGLLAGRGEIVRGEVYRRVMDQVK